MTFAQSNIFKYLTVLVYVTANNQDGNCDVHGHEENYSFNKQPEEIIDPLRVQTDQTLVVRLPLNTLLKYTSYKDVCMLHFQVPSDARMAVFSFKAYEKSKSTFQQKCKPRSVEMHLKAGSYPVISPENITFPTNFLKANQRFKTYSLQFISNQEQHRILINGPQLGKWFAVAFISWTDPNTDRIEQQGLAASCDTLLSAEMSVVRFQPIIIYDSHVQIYILQLCCDPKKCTVNNRFEKQEKKNIFYERNEFIYKFYVSRNIEVATAFISIMEACQDCPNIIFKIQSNAFPNVVNESHQSDENISMYSRHIIQPNQVGDITFKFFVQPEAWHYLHVDFVNKARLETCNEMKQRRTSKLNKSSQLFQKEGNLNKMPDTCNFQENISSFWPRVKYSLQIVFQKSTETNYEESEKNNSYPFYSMNLSNIEFSTAVRNDNIITTEYTHTNSFVNKWRPKRFRGIDFYPLLRQTYREFFMFDYDLIPDENGTVPTVLNLTGGIPAGFSFDVDDVYDIGGTITFALSMKTEFSSDSIQLEQTSYQQAETDRSEKLIPSSDKPSFQENEKEDMKVKEALSPSYQTIIVCMHLAEPGVPSWPDKCRYDQRILPASIIINNTDTNTNTGLIHVPFPESGQWYITMALFCHGAKTAARIKIVDSIKQFLKQNINSLYSVRRSCACFLGASRYIICIKNANCLNSMNDTETFKLKECLMDSKCTPNYLEMSHNFEKHHKLNTEQHLALENCNTSVVFTISSSPCVAGRCGRFGRCYHYMSGGCVFSTCVCQKGYRGWDCTENSQVPTSISTLVASLLLTLSNLLFIPSIYMAVRRVYYTEAVIYFFAMFFSTFYHACDSGEDEYGFCLVKISVLQFCDFYCGLLAIWVTLVAMSHIRQQFVSILHMFGAIILALGTEINKQSLWVFLAPALTGICLISTSWSIRCYKLRKWYPAPKYLAIYMPIGTVVAMLGLICYAFLQTKRNYHIVHSVWHMLMALSILSLLPSRKYFMSNY